jgi:hypothetical protein
MAQECEVCRNFLPEPRRADQELVEVALDVRSVLLCRGHARIAANSGVHTFAALRELYGSGRRSYVPRRRPELEPARAEKRESHGRRANDRARP